MKISWGVKIAALYSCFVVMIACLVAATFFYKSDMVTEDYYQQETVFQQRLDAMKATASLTGRVAVLQQGENIIVQFPAGFEGQPLVGSVRFYAPANAGADRRYVLQTANGRWQTSRRALAAVPYEVQVSWVAGGREYYQAVAINLLRS